MTVAYGVLGILVEEACGADSVLYGIGECTVAEVVEDALHASVMLCLDVVFHAAGVDRSVCYVGIGVQCLAVPGASPGPVMLVVPVLELHAVDMASVEPVHFCGCHTGCLAASEIGHKAIAGEFLPVGTYVHSCGATNGLSCGAGLVYLYHVAFEILWWSLPGPLGAGEIFFVQHFSQMHVSHFGTQEGAAIMSELDCGAWMIAGRVCSDFQCEVGRLVLWGVVMRDFLIDDAVYLALAPFLHGAVGLVDAYALCGEIDA